MAYKLMQIDLLYYCPFSNISLDLMIELTQKQQEKKISSQFISNCAALYLMFLFFIELDSAANVN